VTQRQIWLLIQENFGRTHPLAPTEACGADYARLQETVEEFLA
jgi:hypothetical protein